jgi:excisionase family DNA binding protein
VPEAVEFLHNSGGLDESPESKMAKRAQDRSEPITILNPSDILTPEELAARLKVRRTWVYEKMRRRSRNPLPAIKLGRFLRFNWPSVCEWLHAQSVGTDRRKRG